MTDLTDLQASQTVKIVGSDSTGVEQSFIPSVTNAAGNPTLAVDRRTANDHYANAGRMWSATTDDITVGSITETAVFLLKNPSGSGKTVKVDQVFYSGLGGTNINQFRFYFDPTVTANGTSVPAVGSKQIGQASLSSTLFKSPTVTANGTHFLAVKSQGAGTQNIDFEFGLFVEANHTLLITTIIGVIANPVNLAIFFSEE